MDVVNNNLIVQKVKRGDDTLLLGAEKNEKPGIATYEVIFGTGEYKPGMLVLLNEHDLLHWNKEDKVIKADKIIMRGENG